MTTYSRLTLAFLLLVLIVPQVRADEPPKDGPSVEYYENGNKKSESHYTDGKLEGLWTRWYDNGKKWTEAHYKNGKLEGLWTEWYVDGKKW